MTYNVGPQSGRTFELARCVAGCNVAIQTNPEADGRLDLPVRAVAAGSEHGLSAGSYSLASELVGVEIRTPASINRLCSAAMVAARLSRRADRLRAKEE
jgi:hypothetical protein